MTLSDLICPWKPQSLSAFLHAKHVGWCVMIRSLFQRIPKTFFPGSVTIHTASWWISGEEIVVNRRMTFGTDFFGHLWKTWDKIWGFFVTFVWKNYVLCWNSDLKIWFAYFLTHYEKNKNTKHFFLVKIPLYRTYLFILYQYWFKFHSAMLVCMQFHLPNCLYI